MRGGGVKVFSARCSQTKRGGREEGIEGIEVQLSSPFEYLDMYKFVMKLWAFHMLFVLITLLSGNNLHYLLLSYSVLSHLLC